MSHYNRSLKDDSGDKEKRTSHRQKRKGAKNIGIESPASKAGGTFLTRERLPFIGSTRKKMAETSVHSTKRSNPPISDIMAPWEGFSSSESSFTSIPPLPPRPPPPMRSPELTPSPPQYPIRGTQPGSGQSNRMKPRLFSQRAPSRPPHLPPLRPVTNLSFSRSFTFSFFELPFHQSSRSRADRLRDLVVMLRQKQY